MKKHEPIESDSDIRKQLKDLKPRKVFVGSYCPGLYLEITKAGTIIWRWRFDFAGKERGLTIGRFPAINLDTATSAVAQAREDLAEGRDPTTCKRRRQEAETAEVVRRQELLADPTHRTVERICRQWIQDQVQWSSGQTRRVTCRLQKHLFPFAGKKDAETLTDQDIVEIVERIEKLELGETVHRVHSYLRSALKHAKKRKKITRLPDMDVGLRARPATVSHPVPRTPERLGEILALTSGYNHSPIVSAAMKLLPLVFVRPGELRQARWEDVHLDAKHPHWTFYMTKVKAHLTVPLSSDAVAIFEEVSLLTRDRSEFVFPSMISDRRPMSDGTIVAAYRLLGIPKGEMDPHSWRAIARTMLDEELGVKGEVIERQQGRKPPGLGTTYDRTQYLDLRRVMMEDWARHLKVLREAAIARSRCVAA